MRKSRIEVYDGPTPYPQITEPNQAFSPRQIVEQFARNELTAKVFEDSDMINSDNYSDDEMVNNTIEFEDEFDALDYMNNTKVVKDEPKKDESVHVADSGTESAQAKTTE